MGGGGTTQTQSTGPPGFAIPGISNIMSGIEGLLFPSLAAGAPQFAQMPSSLNMQVAPFTPYQTQGLQSIAGMTGPATQLAGSGANMLNAQLSGAYLNPATNPYLAATYQEAAQPVVQQYEYATAPGQLAAAQGAAGGGPGAGQGSANQQMTALNQYGLGQNLQNLATNIYGGAYEQGVQNQLTAAGLLPSTQGALYTPGQQLYGAGAQQQQQQQTVLNTAFENALRGVQYPWQLAQQASSIISPLLGQTTNVTTGGK